MKHTFVNTQKNKISVTIFEVAQQFQKELYTLPWFGGTLEQQGQRSACDDIVRELHEIRNYPNLKAQRDQLKRMINGYKGGLVVEEGDVKWQAKYDYLVKACKQLRKINFFEFYQDEEIVAK